MRRLRHSGAEGEARLMPIRAEMKSRYPRDWKLRSRFVRFVRARGRCEWCGAEHGKPHPHTGAIVVLTTAHVFDDRPEAASLLNLASTCQRCHLRHDSKLHARRAAETRRKRRALRDLFPEVAHG